MMNSLDPFGYGEHDDSDDSDDSASGVERVLLRRADGPRMMNSLDPFDFCGASREHGTRFVVGRATTAARRGL